MRSAGENILEAMPTIKLADFGMGGPLNLRGRSYVDGRIDDVPYTWT